jgi:hypothetical protein
VGVKTGTTPNYKISLQGVNSSGNPDGTIKGGGSPASKVFSPSGLSWADGSWNWLTLDNTYVCTQGEDLAIVIAYDSGTIDGSNNASFSGQNNGSPNWNYPRVIQNDNGTRSSGTVLPYYGYGSASTAYGRPIQNAQAPSLGLNTTPDEIALKFTLPATWGTAFQIAGARILMYNNAGTAIWMRLYDGTTVLQDKSFDVDVGRVAAYGWQEIYFDETTLSTLNFGQTYRLAFAPQQSTGHFPGRIEVASAADMEAWTGGTNFGWSERTDSGAWSDNTLYRPFIELLVRDWSKGLFRHPGMTGGMLG